MSGSKRQFSKPEKANTSDSNTIANTVVEQNFFSGGVFLSIPANSLQVGDRIKVSAFFRYNTNALSPAINIRLKTGTIDPVTLLSAGTSLRNTDFAFLAVAASARGIVIEAILRVESIGVGGTVFAVQSMDIGGQVALGTEVHLGENRPANTTTTAVNTTVVNTLYFSAQWNAAAVVNNITLEDIVYEKLAA